ncbi:hypothetical protein OROGR_017730 [Orobanche gracilis]
MDWHQQYIGKVKHAVFHTQKAARKRVIVSTEENAIASLDLRHGEIFWRHVLGPSDVIDRPNILNLHHERFSEFQEKESDLLQFWNERCKCNKRAVVRISESTNNPHKLYYKCENDVCNFFKFWEPKNGDINWSAINDNRAWDMEQQQVVMEVRALGGSVQSGFQTLQLGMHGLNSTVGGMKMVLMLCFCISVVILFGLFLIAMK